MSDKKKMGGTERQVDARVLYSLTQERMCFLSAVKVNSIFSTGATTTFFCHQFYDTMWQRAKIQRSKYNKIEKWQRKGR